MGDGAAGRHGDGARAERLPWEETREYWRHCSRYGFGCRGAKSNSNPRPSPKSLLITFASIEKMTASGSKKHGFDKRRVCSVNRRLLFDGTRSIRVEGNHR